MTHRFLLFALFKKYLLNIPDINGFQGNKDDYCGAACANLQENRLDTDKEGIKEVCTEDVCTRNYFYRERESLFPSYRSSFKYVTCVFCFL